jgi:hypothetical protein
MSNKNWSREDVVNWLRECGCEQESDVSVDTDQSYVAAFQPDMLLQNVSRLNGIDSASCPQTYQTVANSICKDPQGALEAVMPIMQQLGVGCPQSFAKALVDVFTVSQDAGIINPFTPESI